jgi:hypothetical protein
LPIANSEGSTKDVEVYLSATSLGGKAASVVWQRPRLVRAGSPDILLRDAWRLDELYRHERDEIFAKANRYLEAADEAFRAGGDRDNETLAAKHEISPIALAAWRQFLGEDGRDPFLGDRIGDRIEMISTFGFIKGWVTPDGASVLANSSEETARTPATFPPRSVILHPSPKRRVLVAWRSPISGPVRIAATVQDSHPGCGNGVEWSLELRRGRTKQILWSGQTNGDKFESLDYPEELRVRQGDGIVLTVGPRDGDFSCDSTDVHFTIESPDHRWSLTDEIVSEILKENPRSDRFGNEEVWHFTTELTDDRSLTPIPAESILARWQLAPSGESKQRHARELSELLSKRPADDGESPNEQLRKTLFDEGEALLTSLLEQAAPVAAKRASGSDAALDLESVSFGRAADGEEIDPESLGGRTGQVIKIRLPGAVAAKSNFVAEGLLAGSSDNSAVQFQVLANRPEGAAPFPEIPMVARPESKSREELVTMCGEFRDQFPVALCYLQVVPVDEVITMLLYYREDEPLCRLMLNESEKAELDRLWDELLFVSREPEETRGAFTQLLEYASQLDPARAKKIAPLEKELNERIEAFRDRQRNVAPRQLDAVVDWAAQAYRRPLSPAEEDELRELYKKLLGEDLEHEEALRLLVARVLSSPHFLYRIEQPSPGPDSAPVSDWELASRLSYFLWSSPPDDELRRAAAEGALGKPDVLIAQTRRMLADARVRNLAVEFGCQWLSVRDFAKLDEKNERIYPTFAEIRGPMYEEAILFFADLLQQNRSVLQLIDADYAFLNEELAEHYGIPDVTGPQWRRVEGVQQYGRGGILGLGAVLAKQSGASRTSPVLRGNWLTSVVLDDELPPPPPDVPPLDDEIPEGLTERQITERHARDPACMTCHSRIDPFGFALEGYDAIGRRREADAAGLPIDSKATLPDGTLVQGLDELRQYLVNERRDEFVRQFCRKLLGYSLGRGFQLSDEPLLTKITDAVKANDYKVATAVELIVTSQQFREIRTIDSRLETSTQH